MKYEKAIDIFERMLSHYQGELYTDSEREMKEALELGKQALQTGEIYMSAVDYNLFLEGYKQGKKDFGRPHGEWINPYISLSGEFLAKCNSCGEDIIASSLHHNYCPNCGAKMQSDLDGYGVKGY